MNNLIDPENENLESSCSDESAASKDLKLIQKIIDKGSQMLDRESYAPRIQDVLKAIQLREKVNEIVKKEDSKSFWAMIEEARQEELPKMYPEDNLESQLKAAIYSLRFEIKNGVVSVKAITDAYNLGKSQELQLTYQRIGHLLSIMGFQKVKMHNNVSGILYDDSLLSPKKHLLGIVPDDPYARPILPSPLVGEGKVENPAKAGVSGTAVTSDAPVGRSPIPLSSEVEDPAKSGKGGHRGEFQIEKNEKSSPPSPPSPPTPP
jgi:hypothetical protein